MTYKEFPDISFHQGVVDWEKMRSRTDSIILRVGQGGWSDNKFQINYAEAKKRGMLRAIYVFYDDRFSPTAHLEMVKSQIGTDLPELEIFVDWENTYGGMFGGVKNVVALMEALERAFLTNDVGLYTGYYWFIEHTNTVLNYFQLQYLKNHKLWLGRYSLTLPPSYIPRPWAECWYWQYGTPVEDYGQQSLEIDMNRFMGTNVGFYDRFAQTGEAMYEGKTNQIAKIWNSVGGMQIDQIASGVTVRGYAPVGDYVQLVQPVAGWTKKIWLSNYVEVTSPPPPPPPPSPTPTTLPAYFVAYDSAGNALGYYDLRAS